MIFEKIVLLKSFIESLPVVLIDDFRKLAEPHRFLIMPYSYPVTDGYFCRRLNITFRSRYEAVISHLFLEWGWNVRYESYMFCYDDGKVYIPDFFLPDYGVWIEAKGTWRLGAKTKFKKAIEAFGTARMILLPYTLERQVTTATKGICAPCLKYSR